MSIENPTLAHFRHFSSLLTIEHRVSSNQRPATRSARTSAHKKTFLCKTNPIFPDFAPKTRILPKNKPNSNPIKANQSQFKPNFRKAKMNVSSVKTKDYEKNDIFSIPQNKPNSNPIKPNQSQFKPNQTQFFALFILPILPIHPN